MEYVNIGTGLLQQIDDYKYIEVHPVILDDLLKYLDIIR